MSAMDDINKYYEKKKEECQKKQQKNEQRAGKSSPATKINKSWFSKMTEDAWSEFKDSPMAQMGKDFVAEQVATNGMKLLNNAESQVLRKVGPVLKTVEDIKDVVFNSVALACTAQDQMGLYFMQQVAKEAVKAIDKKLETLDHLRESVRQLYNALSVLVAGSPFFNKYLSRLRKALIYLDSARSELIGTYNSLTGPKHKWLPKKVESAQNNILEALKLMEPGKVASKGKQDTITNKGLLANVGIPKEPQQLMALLAVPKLCKDVALSMKGYLIASAKVSALLLAFCNGYEELAHLSSNIIGSFTISQLEKIIIELDALIREMAEKINGEENAVAGPIPGFENVKSQYAISISAFALEWSMKARLYYQHIRALPGNSLSILAASNNAVKVYYRAVNKIKAMNGLTSGKAVLVEEQGREEPGQLERQVVSFVLASMKATVSGTASKSVLQTGRTIIARVDLSIQRSREIRQILTTFINTDLGFSKQMTELGNSVDGVLKAFGLDKASDTLKAGKFNEFFNLNNKTMTYAGAALSAIALLKKCMTSDDERAKLDKAELSMKKDQFTKTVSTRRYVNTSHTLAASEQFKKCKNHDTDQNLITNTTKKFKGPCGIDFPFSGGDIMSTLGPVVGLTLFNTNTAQKALAKYGRGIL